MTADLFSTKFLTIGFIAFSSFMTVTSSALADPIEPPPGSGAPSGTVGGSSRLVGQLYRYSEDFPKGSELNIAPFLGLNSNSQSVVEPWFP